MSKQIWLHEKVYVAPGMSGKYKDETPSNPIVIDENNNYEELDPREIDNKILIYEREVKEWFLNRAHDLVQDDMEKIHETHDETDKSSLNGFIILMICMAYLEGVEQYRRGKSSDGGKSCKFFIESIRRIYPGSFQESHLKKMYRMVRCGLFHNGMVKGGVVFGYSYSFALKFERDGDEIRINPRKLLEDIMRDFNEYINLLRNDSESRNNFDCMFSILPESHENNSSTSESDPA